MSFRAVKTLNQVDIIAAEDTRRTGILLKHFNIGIPMMSYHKFNEKQSLNKVIGYLAQGKKSSIGFRRGHTSNIRPWLLVGKRNYKRRF